MKTNKVQRAPRSMMIRDQLNVMTEIKKVKWARAIIKEDGWFHLYESAEDAASHKPWPSLKAMVERIPGGGDPGVKGEERSVP